MADNIYQEFEKFINENKGKRKFKQSVEVAVNFKNIDFSKQENRLNLEVLLPNGKGKESKVLLFANEKETIDKAKALGIEVITQDELQSIANDKKRLKQLLNYELYAQASMMPTIAKLLGPFLGPRNKLPKPILPNQDLKKLLDEAKRKINIKTKGRFLPTVHFIIGKEDMDPKSLYENLEEALNAIKRKVGDNAIRSVYIKLTMSPSKRLI